VLQWKYAIGDKVRNSKCKHIFHKGYHSNWTDEIFTIAERYPTHPVTYGLQDLAGENIIVQFYEPKLQKVINTDDMYEEEKDLATALPHTVTVVAYIEFENLIEIDRNRNVVFDFNNLLK
jgi:hypothetical protein